MMASSNAPIVTRERVIAPPDRFVDVSDGELLKYFQEAFGKDDRSNVSKLHEMLDGICMSSFSEMRRILEQDFAFFAAAAAARPSSDPRMRDPDSAKAELDNQECRFLTNLWDVLHAGHYKMLSSSEWDAAMAEEFLLTLPVSVNWKSFDNGLLPRALWPSHPSEQAAAPEQLRDRVLVFHRGVDVARIKGKYFLNKIDLLISFFILQPLFQLLYWLLTKVGLQRLLGEAPSYLTNADGAPASAPAATEESTNTSNDSLHPTKSERGSHAAAINIERRTFAREFSDGRTTFQQFFKTVELQEACFKDVVVVYRAAISDKSQTPGEFDIINDSNSDFLKRNIVLKRFCSIPIADLELIFPEKKVFMPPQVFVNMMVTVIGAFLAVFSAIRGGIDAKILWTTLTMLGTRLGQVYTTAVAKRTAIEQAMQKIIFNRTIASQEAVLTSIREEMARQLTRETFITYCILANSPTPLRANDLDARCEAFLSQQFGLHIDFTTENALKKLLQWRVVRPVPLPTAAKSSSSSASDHDGYPGQWAEWIMEREVEAIPLSEALQRLDEVWDSLNEFVPAKANRTGSFAAGGNMHTKARTQDAEVRNSHGLEGPEQSADKEHVKISRERDEVKKPTISISEGGVGASCPVDEVSPGHGSTSKGFVKNMFSRFSR